MLGIIRLSFFLLPMMIFSMTFTWVPRGIEPSFSFDIPNSWSKDFVLKENGAIIFFRDDKAIIEVRSFVLDDEMTFEKLMNMKAARMSAHYNAVDLVHEKLSETSLDTYFSTWNLKKNGKEYVDSTVIVKQADLVISMSCISLKSDFSTYNVIFKNAIASLKMLEDEAPGRSIEDLKQFFPFNLPNRNYNNIEKNDVSVKK